MTKKSYKHIAIESELKDEFDKVKENLKKFKKDPTDSETMKILIQKNKKITLGKQEVINTLWGEFNVGNF